MLIWFGGVGADRKGELLQSPLSENSLEIACYPNDTRGNDSLGFFSVSSNLNGVISKTWGSWGGGDKEPILREMSQEEGETKTQAKKKKI